MNDRYLYRAKRIDNGEWVEGFLIFEKDRAFIAHRVCEVMNSYSKTGEEYGFGNFIEVYPSTICQCTGLKDEDGKLIWESDVVKDKYVKYRVIWSEEEGSWMLQTVSGAMYGIGSINSEKYVVVGNFLMKEVRILVKEQKKIDFINDCNAIVDYEELENAILWYSEKPTISKKHIYLHGMYPAVSISKEKIHIHRLLMMYWLKSKIPSEFSVHHINGNRLDARKENLSVILNSTHASKHNKGKNVTDNVRNHMIEFNHTRKGTRQPHHRKDISYSDVKELFDKGYSLNKIANELGCDWGTAKARVDDIFDNPELVEVGE